MLLFLNAHRPRKRSVFDHIKCSHRVSPFLLFDLLVSFLWSGSVRLSTKESLMLTLHWASKQERYLSSGAHTHRLLWGRLENCLFSKLFHRSVYCPASEALADTIRCLLGMLVRSAWPCDRMCELVLEAEAQRGPNYRKASCIDGGNRQRPSRVPKSSTSIPWSWHTQSRVRSDLKSFGKSTKWNKACKCKPTIKVKYCL